MKKQTFEEFIASLNPNKMLKIGKYEIPDDIYKQGGIPNEVINSMIELVIAKDKAITQSIRDYYEYVKLLYPEDVEQMFRIVNFLGTIQCDLCTKMACPKRDEKGEQQ